MYTQTEYSNFMSSWPDVTIACSHTKAICKWAQGRVKVQRFQAIEIAISYLAKFEETYGYVNVFLWSLLEPWKRLMLMSGIDIPLISWKIHH